MKGIPIEPLYEPEAPQTCEWCESITLFNDGVLYLPYDDNGEKCFCDDYCLNEWVYNNFDEYSEEMEDYNDKRRCNVL